MILRRTRVNSLRPARGDGVGGAFRAAAVAAGGLGSDELVADETADGVIERAALEGEDFVLVAQAEQALHLVGMHGPFAQEGKDGNFPDSEFGRHIVQMNYIA